MIIVCPSCATSYDVEDERFSPNGRSVRCAACDCSWFVPSPEPIKDLMRRRNESPRKPKAWREDDAAGGENAENETETLFDDRRGESRDSDDSDRARSGAPVRRRARQDPADAGEARRRPLSDGPRQAEPDTQDAAFPLRQRTRPARRAETGKREPDSSWRRDGVPVDMPDDDSTYFEDDDVLFAPDLEDDDPPARRSRAQAGLRFSDHGGQKTEKTAGARTSDDRRPDRRGDAVVDADWEDIDDGDDDKERETDRTRGYGRRVRAERRRATALAAPEEFASLDPSIFDEEFFTSLHVQPKELEKALRKARRRAETREKNRLTPWRALGWSIWIGAVSATLFGLYAYRNEIVRSWPNTAGAYAVIGIEANPYGLAIEDVRHRLAMSTAGPTIEITGRLRNERDAAVKPPLLQAEALGPRGELLSRWTFEADGEEVLAGDAVDFITRAPAPEGVVEVALSFAPEKGGVISVGDFLTRR